MLRFRSQSGPWIVDASVMDAWMRNPNYVVVMDRDGATVTFPREHGRSKQTTLRFDAERELFDPESVRVWRTAYGVHYPV